MEGQLYGFWDSVPFCIWQFLSEPTKIYGFTVEIQCIMNILWPCGTFRLFSFICFKNLGLASFYHNVLFSSLCLVTGNGKKVEQRNFRSHVVGDRLSRSGIKKCCLMIQRFIHVLSDNFRATKQIDIHGLLEFHVRMNVYYVLVL